MNSLGKDFNGLRGDLYKAASYLCNSASFYSKNVSFDVANTALTKKLEEFGVDLTIETAEDRRCVKDAAMEIARKFELLATAKAKIERAIERLDLELLCMYVVSEYGCRALKLSERARTEQMLGANIPAFYAKKLAASVSGCGLVAIEFTNEIIASINSKCFEILTAAK
jgi:hypothetical protein